MYGESPNFEPKLPGRIDISKDLLAVRQGAQEQAAEELTRGPNNAFDATLAGTLRLHEDKKANLMPNLIGKFVPAHLLRVGKSGKLELPEVFAKEGRFAKGLANTIEVKLDPKIRAANYKSAEFIWLESGGKKEEFEKMVKEGTHENVKIGVTLNILRNPDNLKPGKLELLEKWNHEQFELQKRLENGEIEPGEFAKAMEGSYKRCVEQFGDEDAKRMWEAYEKGELDMSSEKAERIALAEVAENSSIGLVDVAAAIGEADKALVSTGIKVNYSFFDGASVESADGFSLPLKVGKTSEGYSFYLKDPNSNNGFIGPIKSNMIATELDKRHADGFLTQRMTKLLNDNGSIAKVPDQYVTKLVYKLMGEGQTRNFSLGKRQRAILEGLAKVLVVEDGKLPTVYKKILALNEYVKKEGNTNYFVKSLLKGNIKNVSEFLSEGDSGASLAD